MKNKPSYEDLEKTIIDLNSQIAELQHSQKLETAAGEIAHDINNILGIILGNAEIGIDIVPESSLVAKSLNQIKVATKQARLVVDKILVLSQKTFDASELSVLEMENKKELSKNKGKILFVEDNKLLIKLVKNMLEVLGYTVDGKINPIEALTSFKDDPDYYDLIITDMTMPCMNGMTLSKEILKIRPDVPIILCTGHSEAVDEEKALKSGIKGFIMKPFSRLDMSDSINKVLGQ